MRVLPPLVTLAALFATGIGCTWVGPDAYDEKIALLDEDGDGAPKGGPNKDCDDDNPFSAPGFIEIPYDGFDNDCQGGDVVDVDGDAFPGIPKSVWEARNPSAKRAPWPDGVDDGEGANIDCRDASEADAAPYRFIDVSLTEEALADFKPDRSDAPAATLVFHPDAKEINPGEAADAPYDGVDQNCDGVNDFDQDGDGYMPRSTDEVPDGRLVSEAFADWQAEWGYAQASVLFGDCLDLDADIHPDGDIPNSNPAVFYDGVDTHCTGHNDFDIDGDGFMPAQAFLCDGAPLGIGVTCAGTTTPVNVAAALPDYLGTYLGRTTPPAAWGLADIDERFDDCLDQPDPAFADLDAASVHPGSAEQWYDGIDSDCAGDNDFDYDHDDYPRDIGDYDYYEDHWVHTDVPSISEIFDCDDVDALVFPGALERWGDSVDQDCDGLPDATPFAFQEITWESPRSVRIDETDPHILITTGADRYQRPSAVPVKDVGVAFMFDKLSGYDANFIGVPVNFGTNTSVNAQPLGAQIDSYSIGPRHYVASSYRKEGTPTVSVTNLRELEFLPVSNNYTTDIVTGTSQGSLTMTDSDVRPTNDLSHHWSLACSPTVMWFLVSYIIEDETAQEPWDMKSEGEFKRTATGDESFGQTCFLEFDSDDPLQARATVCDGFDPCTSYDLVVKPIPASIKLSASQPWADTVLLEADTEDNWLIARPVGGGVLVYNLDDGTRYDLLDSVNVISADIAWRGPTLYLAAVIENALGERSVEIYDGDPEGAGLVAHPLPFWRDLDETGKPVGDLVPYDISVHATADRLVVAVSADHETDAADLDAVGWSFVGFAP